MKRVPLFLAATLLVALSLAACGTSDRIETNEVTLGRGQEITFKAIGGQSGPIEVKVVFTTVENEDVYFQAFTDGEIMSGGQKVYNDLNLFLGLTLQPETPPQLTIEYDPKLWEVKP